MIGKTKRIFKEPRMFIKCNIMITKTLDRPNLFRGDNLIKMTKDNLIMNRIIIEISLILEFNKINLLNNSRIIGTINKKIS